MARLGKAERMAKRALIKANLKGPRESTPKSMCAKGYNGSIGVDATVMLGRTHTGYREPQNAKGTANTSSRPQRWSQS